MSGFTRSPRLMKGAILSFDIFSPIPQIIIFQYNPDSLKRTLQGQSIGGGGEGNPAEALRLKGPPVESINLDIELDATDQLEQAGFPATDMGIYPQLSALEMMLYPKSSVVIANTVLAALGTIEIVAPEGPFTLFIWGPKRILPVRLTDFSISEEAHDTNLNPIRAKVSLGLRVLSYVDLKLTHPGYALFLAHQIIKEVMAGIGSIGGVGGLSTSLVGQAQFSASAEVSFG